VSRTSSDIEGVGRVATWNDLDDADLWEGIDTVVHLAGYAHDTRRKADELKNREVNTNLTIKIYDAFLRSKASKFIFVSSVKALADTVVGEKLTEEATPAPVGHYGESKLAAERYIQTHKAEGKSVYILRPCLVYGLGCKGNLKSLVRFVKLNLPWPLAAWENQRSLLAMDNLSYVIHRIIDGNVPSGDYNLADDATLSTNKMIAIISWVVGTEPHMWAVPKFLIKMLAHIGTMLHLPLNDYRLQKLTEDYVVDNSKIKAALGIDEMPAAVETAFRDSIASMLL
jgi:nucleoside-diphosphate-sugar epimerase